MNLSAKSIDRGYIQPLIEVARDSLRKALESFSSREAASYAENAYFVLSQVVGMEKIHREIERLEGFDED